MNHEGSLHLLCFSCLCPDERIPFAWFLLNLIEVLVLPAHSSYLLQIFDVSVAALVKTVFKQEPDNGVDRTVHAEPEQRQKAQIIRRVLGESFINALRRAATPGNIESGSWVARFIPFNPQIPLDSAYAVDPGLFHTRVTGTEINETVLTPSEDVEFLYRHEHGRNLAEDDYRAELLQIWDRLRDLSVMMGRALSDPPPLFMSGDHDMIIQVGIPTMPL
jgi:hypothetical protein